MKVRGAVAAVVVLVAVFAAAGWSLSRSRHDEAATLQSDVDTRIGTVEASADGRLLATGGSGGVVRLWDVATASEKAELAGHAKGVKGLAFSPDGKLLASASVDRTVRVWDVPTGSCTATLTGFSGPVFSVRFSPDGRTLAAGEMHSVRLWTVGTPGTNLRALTGHKSDIIGVTFLDGGKTLVSVGCDRQARYWDAATGQPRGQFPLAADLKSGHLKGFSVTADGATAVTTIRGEVLVLDLAGRREREPIRPKAGILHGVAVAPDGSRVAVASEGRGVVVWDAAGNKELASLRGHNNYAATIAPLPDGKQVVTGGIDGTIKFWDISK